MITQPVAIVTGAGSGIGQAVALQLYSEGFAVCLVGRTESKLLDTIELINEQGHETQVMSWLADVGDEQQVDALVAAVLERFGRIDTLVNVAGYAALASIKDTDKVLWDKMIHVNLTGPMNMTRSVWKSLEASDRAIVVNISSMAAADPFPGFGAYATTKAGLNMLTLVTAREGEAVGIKAVAIGPGAVETPLLRSLFDEKKIPVEQTLSPKQVADAVVDCITGRREFQLGETIYLASP